MRTMLLLTALALFAAGCATPTNDDVVPVDQAPAVEVEAAGSGAASAPEAAAESAPAFETVVLTHDAVVGAFSWVAEEDFAFGFSVPADAVELRVSLHWNDTMDLDLGLMGPSACDLELVEWLACSLRHYALEEEGEGWWYAKEGPPAPAVLKLDRATLAAECEKGSCDWVAFASTDVAVLTEFRIVVEMVLPTASEAEA